MKYLFIMMLYGLVSTLSSQIELHILGIVQDAGAPQIGCKKDCCTNSTTQNHQVVALGLIDYNHQKIYLIEASPDMPEQLNSLARKANFKGDWVPDGIFLTHAHIGHYTGLMYLGRESMNADSVLVYTMPRMYQFLTENGPWDQLVALKNIHLHLMQNEESIQLSSALRIRPFLVPHRDEYSETVGYEIIGPKKTALFIPDIDKWERWELDLREELKRVDYAFIDATFYDAEEVNYRPIEEIPHPFIVESMNLLDTLPKKEKNKVYFIHLNHTNPALDSNSEASQLILKKGYHIARKEMIFKL